MIAWIGSSACHPKCKNSFVVKFYAQVSKNKLLCFYHIDTRRHNGDSGSSAVAGEHWPEAVLLQNHVGNARLCKWKAQCALGKVGRSFCTDRIDKMIKYPTDILNPACLFTCKRSCALRWTQSSTRTRMWRTPSTGCWRAATWSAARALSTACLSLSRNGHPCTAKSRSGRSCIFLTDVNWPLFKRHV